MEPIWLRQYPEGVPTHIDANRYASLVDILERAMLAHSDRIAFISMGHRLRYADIDRLSQHFASYLQNVLGLQQGARVALLLPNLLQYPVTLIGTLRAGMVPVNINPAASEATIAHLLQDSGASAVVVAEPFAHALSQVLPTLGSQPLKVIVTATGDLLPITQRTVVNARVRYLRRSIPRWHIKGHVDFQTVLGLGSAQPFNRCVLTHDDIALLQYTSGTTGMPAGVVLSHGNLVANVVQARAWITPWVEEGDETIVTILPLHHIFALTANLLVFFSLGAANLLIADPRDRVALVRTLAAHRFTTFTGINTLFNDLLNTPGFGALDFSSLKFTLGGGAAIQPAVAKRWSEVTRKPLTEAYGLTEASPAVTISPLSRPEYSGSVGLPLPSTEVSIRDEAGSEVAIGVAGELCVRGPQVMSAYWQQPERTRKACTKDGFLRTGDVATIDTEGYVYIIDRLGDVIIHDGFSVYPNAVEAVVAQCDGVLECACVGMPAGAAGEAVRLFVVRVDEGIGEEHLRAFCAEHLSRHQQPREIIFVDELPRSQVGKVLRKELRQHATDSNQPLERAPSSS